MEPEVLVGGAEQEGDTGQDDQGADGAAVELGRPQDPDGRAR